MKEEEKKTNQKHNEWNSISEVFVCVCVLQSRTETIRYETKNRLNDKIKLPHLHLLSGIAEIWLFSPRRMEMRWIACDMTLVCIKVYLFELMLLLFFFFFFCFCNLQLDFIFYLYLHTFNMNVFIFINAVGLLWCKHSKFCTHFMLEVHL